MRGRAAILLPGGGIDLTPTGVPDNPEEAAPEAGLPEIEPFLRAFDRAVRLEMDAMRERLGSFEVALEHGRSVESGTRYRYAFRLRERNDRLLAGMECTFRSPEGEQLVSVIEASGAEVLLESDRALPTGAAPLSLVIYPWFLYERLLATLREIPERDDYQPERALRAFGKRPPRAGPPVPAATSLAELDSSQRAAVALCLRSDPAFVWGPPGTGKTRTLGHIVEALHARGERVLVCSTTNAAVDQALEKLAALESFAPALRGGEVVRVGRTEAPTHGVELRELAARLGAEALERIAGLVRAREIAEHGARSAAEAKGRIRARPIEGQLELFETAPPDLSASLDPEAVQRLLGSPPAEHERLLDAWEQSCRTEAARVAEEISRARQLFERSERRILDQSRVVLATLSALSVNPLLRAQRFDAVIVEEAGMAVLPAVFHCACLARRRVLFVGDPRQLPPIVQSQDPFARRALGRSVFAVTAPDPEHSELVALLSLQYRMHPEIGELVSRLFYGGKVQNGVAAAERADIAGAPPMPGSPLVLLDTAGTGACRTPEGSYSRYNESTAESCTRIVEELALTGVRSVAVITPYVEQARLIRRLLASRGLDEAECRTVHRFQGNERDVVILDTVDTEPYAPGVLLAGAGEGSSAANLLNVSVSRARGKLIVIADVGYYLRRAAGSAIARLLEAMRAGGGRYSTLRSS